MVRSASIILLIVAILFCDYPRLEGAKPVLAILLAMLMLVLLQLVPLPPALWQALPGRAMLVEASAASGQDLPWRPLSMVPGATVNAAAALIVPITALILAAGMKDTEGRQVPGLLLVLIAATTLLGLLQFSGAGFNNPLVNDVVGEVSGTFANRNHFALFLAFGCLLAPVWAFLGRRRAGWRGPVSLGLTLLFVLTILASGSRAGMVLGLLALGIALVLTRSGIQKELSHYPRWVFPVSMAGIVGFIAVFILLSVGAGRAVSIERLFAVDPGQDIRTRAIPTIFAMIGDYFPAGTGAGTFDPVFRINEPFELLRFPYLNHVHNDFLEIMVDAGLPGLIILVCAICWWAFASLRAWRASASAEHMLPKLGSAILLLVFIASAFDYPARTPMIMAVIVVAAMWLGKAARPALPPRN